MMVGAYYNTPLQQLMIQTWLHNKRAGRPYILNFSVPLSLCGNIECIMEWIG